MVTIPQYAPVVRKTKGDFSAAALVGTHSVSLGWNAKDGRQAGLKGFAVRRQEVDLATGEVIGMNWLRGEKRFKCDTNDGFDVSSREAPFQRFRWSDYTLKADRGYIFDIYPARGAPCALSYDDEPISLRFRPSPEMVDGVGAYVNRGVTSAFAYLERFKNQKPQDVPDGAALRWLSRGLKEALLGFIEAVAPGEELHVCIYEFFDEDVARALAAALGRGVAVEIVYHAPAGDHATTESAHNLQVHGLSGVAHARTAVENISHNKFAVHLRGGQPLRLFTGSCNFSTNAFYLQTNAAVIFDDPAAAARYELYFQLLATDPLRIAQGNDANDVRRRVADMLGQMMPAQGVMTRQFFSPVQPLDMLDAAVEIVRNARSCVLTSAPFSLDQRIKTAIVAQPPELLHYGLANATVKKSIEMLNNANSRFFTPTRLETYAGRAWDAKAFGAHKIHTKLIIADPWSDDPVMLFGSANFSDESCRKNDENAFITRDPRLIAIMATEFLRMFDHYKSRGFINAIRERGLADEDYLDDTDGWMRTSFTETPRSHKYRDRLVFSGN